MITDLDRWRYALELATAQLRPGPIFDPKADKMITNDPENQLPVVKKFLRELAEGNRPGFDKYVESRMKGHRAA